MPNKAKDDITSPVTALIQCSKNYPLLTKEEELALGVIIKTEKNATKRKEAIDILVMSNVRLVILFAKEYYRQGIGVDFSDIVQSGLEGVIQSAGKFDPDKGVRFSTYAAWAIRQSIQTVINQSNNGIHVPQDIVVKMKKIQAIRARYQNTYGYTPDVAELSEITGLSEKEIKNILEIPTNSLSLDDSINDKNSIAEIIPDNNAGVNENETSAETADITEKLRAALKTLSPREENVLRLRYGLDDGKNRSLEEICVLCGISKATVSEVIQSAQDKLKHPSRSYLLLSD